jgi:hypothetical protein
MVRLSPTLTWTSLGHSVYEIIVSHLQAVSYLREASSRYSLFAVNVKPTVGASVYGFRGALLLAIDIEIKVGSTIVKVWLDIQEISICKDLPGR